MTVRCFMIEATDRVRLSLRRHRSSESERCLLPRGYHDVLVPIGEAPAILDSSGCLQLRPERKTIARDDSRWPTHCACGAAFVDGDEWQVFQDRIYRRADTGEERSLRDWHEVPGAMWDAVWWPEKGPDGRCLTVALPDGREWMIDGPSNNGNGWTRTGAAPLITARPSILTPGYHGWLTEGVLTPC